jgi:hypothetical protein
MGKVRQVKAKLAGVGFGFGTALAVLMMAPGVAHATSDPSCYAAGSQQVPGEQQCTSTLPDTTDGSGSVVTASDAPSGSSLPFTGADIAEMAVIGTAALGTGVFLVRRSRRATA